MLLRVISTVFATIFSCSNAWSEGLPANLPPQPLADALDAFTKATGYQLVYRSELAVGMTSRGAEAGLPAGDTLRQLLRGTGLDFKFVNDRTVVIFRSPDNSNRSNLPPPGPTPNRPQARAGTDGSATDLANTDNEKRGDKNVTHRGLLERIAGFFAVCGAAMAGNMACAQDNSAGAAPEESMAEVILTGTRQGGLQAAESPAPIQILSNQTLEQLKANPDLMSTLAQVVPSLTMQAFGPDMAGQTLQAKLRGLSPNDVLILVNGKRRHTTANLEVDSGSVYQGGANADLNFIPLDAIDHIEVLTDGAAAQYGTDAIAGVINIILKKDSSGGTVSGTYGNYFDGGGNTGDVSGNVGFAPADGAFVNVTAEIHNHGHSNRGGVDERVVNPANLATYPGSNMPSVNGYPYINLIDGDAETHTKLVSINSGFNLSPDTQIYAFATYGDKNAASYENYRPPTKVQYTNPTTGVTTYPFPFGFDPQEATHEIDYSVAAGVKGILADWNWDLGTVYGRDHLDVYTLNSANAGIYNSTGDATPSNFYDGFLAATQWATTLDINRDFDVGMAGPLNIAYGAEYRRDSYQIGAGIPESYQDGGAQSYPGFAPTDSGANSRRNYAGYVDLAGKPLEQLRLDLAGRYEHYSDFGSATVGKLTGRWDFSPEFAVRGTVNNGFRAPTLAEEFYSSTTVTPVTAFVQLPPDSVGGKLLGLGTGLQAEKSMAYSLGMVFRPTPSMNMTLDVYQITITNRIVGSGELVGSDAGKTISSVVNEAIAANGNQLDPDVLLTGETGVTLFTNGIDTRTRGGDFTFNFPLDYALGHVNYSVGATYNDTVVTSIRSTPAQLGVTPLFDPEALSDITTASPRYIANFGVSWTYGKAAANLLEKLYGPSSEYENDDSDNPTHQLQYFRTNIPVTPITDLSLSYQFMSMFKVTLGAANLFNRYPPHLNGVLLSHYDSFTYGDNQGVQHYPQFSPFGIDGGFYYVRGTLTF
jgi:iron complex outermembrane recepter protein